MTVYYLSFFGIMLLIVLILNTLNFLTRRKLGQAICSGHYKYFSLIFETFCLYITYKSLSEYLVMYSFLSGLIPIMLILLVLLDLVNMLQKVRIYENGLTTHLGTVFWKDVKTYEWKDDGPVRRLEIDFVAGLLFKFKNHLVYSIEEDDIYDVQFLLDSNKILSVEAINET